MRQRARRSTTAMRNDPFTLQIALDAKVGVPSQLGDSAPTSFLCKCSFFGFHVHFTLKFSIPPTLSPLMML